MSIYLSPLVQVLSFLGEVCVCLYLQHHKSPNYTKKTKKSSAYRYRIHSFFSPKWFLFFVSVSYVAQSMCVLGLIGVTTSTLEKRFDFSSTQASMISSVYEFASKQ